MSRRESKFKYTSARERAEKQDAGYTAPYLRLPKGATLFKPKAGILLLDILPYEAGKNNPFAEPGMMHWERTFWVHRGIGSNGDSYLCARKNSGGRCPVCEFRAKLQKDDPDKNEELVKDLAPKQRQLFNIIDRRNPDKGVQLWSLSYHTFGKVLDARLRNADEDDDWDKFFFLEEGQTLKVGMKEDSFGGNAFLTAETIDFKPRKEPYDEDILEQVHCLDDVLVETDYDKLKAILLETEDEDEDEDEEEEAPRKKSSKPVADEDEDEEEEAPRKKSSKKDEDEEEEEEEEDEEEEAPRKKSSKKDEEEEDEDEDEEEEEEEEDEEEEKPRKKSSKPAADDDDWDEFDADREEKPKKASKKDDEDEEEEEEEEEEKPRIKTKDEEDEEDADEEEEKPRKKARR